jgi:F-type H+-transporting ATPase subunit b
MEEFMILATIPSPLNACSLSLAFEEQGGAFNPLQFGNWSLFFWTVIIFASLYFVLSKLAFGPLMKTVKERETKISGDLAAAEKALADAAALQKQNQAALDAAQSNARALLDEARERAQKLQQELSKKAEAEAEALVARARAEIEAERVRASAELSALIADLSADVATRVLSRNVKREDCLKDSGEVLAALKRTLN